MSELQTKNDHLPATPEEDPFIAFGRAAKMTRIVGKLLKFDRFGDWHAGSNNEEVPLGTELIAVMDNLLIGWIRWESGKPTDQVMGRVIDMFKPPLRSELGDTDEDQWPIDNKGEQRDPWQASYYLLLKDANSDQFYTYATSSKGGKGALGALAEEYGNVRRHRPNQSPIIRLGNDSYVHREYGKTIIPTLEIVGWASSDEVKDALARDEAEGGEHVETETPPKKDTPKKMKEVNRAPKF